MQLEARMFGHHPAYQRDGLLSVLTVMNRVRPLAWLTGDGIQVEQLAKAYTEEGFICIADRRQAGKKNTLRKVAGVKNSLWVISHYIDNLAEILDLVKAKDLSAGILFQLLQYPECCYEEFDAESNKGEQWVFEPESRVFQYAAHVPCEACLSDPINSPTAIIEREFKESIGPIDWERFLNSEHSDETEMTNE